MRISHEGTRRPREKGRLRRAGRGGIREGKLRSLHLSGSELLWRLLAGVTREGVHLLFLSLLSGGLFPLLCNSRRNRAELTDAHEDADSSKEGAIVPEKILNPAPGGRTGSRGPWG